LSAAAPRVAALAGLGAGLAAAPFADVGVALAAPVAGALAIALASRAGLLALLGVAFAFAGLLVGDARLAAIDGGALRAEPGEPVEARGFVTGPASRDGGTVRLPVTTEHGRFLIETGLEQGEVDIGAEVVVSGRATRGPPWLRDRLRALGVATVVQARAVQPTGRRRGGIAGFVDGLRRQSERALNGGMPERETALARGFVLGQDDRIDDRTVQDFRRSGLAHLLAVSGQNVALLAILATPFLALLGLTVRARLVCTAALIAVYVPLAGGGPSIQRAGVMGIASLLALGAGRPSSRLYALLLAAAATLALNPRASADVGWQLSFAAVAGILLITAPLARGLAAGLAPGPWQRAAAEGVAMSVAATVATAPLVAHHFGTLPVASLPANLVALPAVAPSMWLGMLSAAVGQVPVIPAEPLNRLNALLLAYIAQVAEWFGDPSWATAEVHLDGPVDLALAYAGIAAACFAVPWVGRLRVPAPGRMPRALLAAGACLAVLAVALPSAARVSRSPAPAAGTLRLTVLDVGQGDATLLEPPSAPAVLVDTGPVQAEVGRRLREAGIERLGAVVLTHDQDDHAGGLAGIAAEIEVRRFVFSRASAAARSVMAAAGARTLRLAAGGEIRSGGLRLEALWPPRELAVAPGPSGDPNSRSLVLLAEWRRFSILLTGDAEAELAPVDPGPVDVLKVAHHGSADPGLVDLLRRTMPRLAVVSVGPNPYGHPAPETIASLHAAGVPVLRTDSGGDLVFEASGRRLRLADK